MLGMEKDFSAKDRRELLLVESSTQEAEQLIALVQRYGVRVHHLESSIEAIQHLQEHTVDFIVIEEHSTPMDALQTIEYLQQELKLDTPVFISSVESRSYKKGTVIKKPFLEDEVIFALFSEDGVIAKNNDLQQEELYKLDYLEELSGGNEEFIQSSLEIFVQSVSAKLGELEQARLHKNYDQAREVAHSIKPSFQMLMNSRGTEICDEINYNFKEEDFPALVEELKEIFIKIKTGIEERK
jgi:HPt (histidine-containing phosphotransfer) domain-containing protein